MRLGPVACRSGVGGQEQVSQIRPAWLVKRWAGPLTLVFYSTPLPSLAGAAGLASVLLLNAMGRYISQWLTIADFQMRPQGQDRPLKKKAGATA